MPKSSDLFSFLMQIHCLNPSTASSHLLSKTRRFMASESSGQGTPGFHQLDLCAPGTAPATGTWTSLPASWVWEKPGQEFQPGHRGMKRNGWRKRGMLCAGASIPTGGVWEGVRTQCCAPGAVQTQPSLSCPIKPLTEAIKTSSGIILQGLFNPVQPNAYLLYLLAVFTHQLCLLSNLNPQFVLVFAQATSVTSCSLSLPLSYPSTCIFCFPRSFLGVWKENKMSFLCRIPPSHRWTKKGAKQKTDLGKISQPQPSLHGNGPWNQVEICVGIFNHTAEVSAAGFKEVQEKHKRFSPSHKICSSPKCFFGQQQGNLKAKIKEIKGFF